MKILLVLFSCFINIINANAQMDSLSEKFPVDSGYFSSFDGVKIYYEVRGKGKPVLLVHGFVVNSNSWKKGTLYYDLLKGGYQVIILDMRGNGKSDKPHDTAAYENDAEAKDIMKLIDLLNIKEYYTVGYSRGSIITTRLLILDKKVHGAVLGGMGADFTNPEWPRRKMFYRALMGDTIPLFKGDVDYVKQQGFDQLALAYLQKAQPSTSREELSKIKQSILVVSGDKDKANGSASELSGLLSNSTLATVHGDHNHAASTQEFANVVIRFLKKNGY